MTQQALHTWTGGFSAILLCKSSQAQSGWMGTVSGQSFSCSIGFKSGIWLGHSRTFTELSLSHSCVALVVYLGSLSFWKVNLRLSLRSWALWNRFFAPFSFPSTLTILPVPAAKRHPPQHEAATSCFYFWDVTPQVMSRADFHSNMMLKIEVHQTR